mmetsp:Transcript_67258/g.193393  ORF Transcript_67258/g.193393 Transcript_67258/m.193393 type:complete len:237 (+) Transcript_67258:33-743(+)
MNNRRRRRNSIDEGRLDAKAVAGQPAPAGHAASSPRRSSARRKISTHSSLASLPAPIAPQPGCGRGRPMAAAAAISAAVASCAMAPATACISRATVGAAARSGKALASSKSVLRPADRRPAQLLSLDLSTCSTDCTPSTSPSTYKASSRRALSVLAQKSFASLRKVTAISRLRSTATACASTALAAAVLRPPRGSRKDRSAAAAPLQTLYRFGCRFNAARTHSNASGGTSEVTGRC